MTTPRSGAAQVGAAATAGARWVERALATFTIALLVGVAVWLGVLDWYALHAGSGGEPIRLPVTFASGDHPFHLAKERAVLDALSEGRLPRWIGNHQSGYPTEFYPLGGDVVVAAAWVLLLGQAPLEVVHKLVIVAVLFLPVLGWWLAARRERLPAGIPATATVLHLFVPGTWLAGGPRELLETGLWPHVFATYLTLFLVLGASDWVSGARRVGLLVAIGCGSLAVYSNPRSLVGVGVALGALLLAVAWTAAPWRAVVLRAAIAGGLILLLTSALLAPLAAHQDRYEFARFVAFTSGADLARYTRDTLPIPVLLLAVLGTVSALRGRSLLPRVFAIQLLGSVVAIALTGWLLRDLSVFAQLEGPRLMPMLRLPGIFLAAIGLHTLAAAVTRWLGGARLAVLSGPAALGLAAVIVMTPLGLLGADERGLPETETTRHDAFTDTVLSIERYEALADESDRVVVIGSPLELHGSFWVPALTERSAFQVDWIWYWRALPEADKTQLSDWSLALELDFLQRHALTSVLVATNNPSMIDAANQRPWLELIEPPVAGGFAIYRVAGGQGAQPGWAATEDGQVTRVDVQNERVTIQAESRTDTTLRLAINAFPGWEARVNGRPTPIEVTADGYMQVTVPEGDATITFRYGTTPVVWLGRALVGIGLLLLMAVVGLPTLRRRVES